MIKTGFILLIGFIIGFAYSVWLLDGLYRKTFKRYRDAMDREYTEAMRIMRAKFITRDKDVLK